MQEPLDVIPIMGNWVRWVLAGMALGLVGLFAVAVWLNPYSSDGSPRRMETHRQLGLPACRFYELTKQPCPSCGMTTSFAFFVRGDLVNSVRANAAGTLLAGFCGLFLLWCTFSAWRGHSVWLQSVERVISVFVLLFLGVMLLRWVIVLGLAWYDGSLRSTGASTPAWRQDETYHLRVHHTGSADNDTLQRMR